MKGVESECVKLRMPSNVQKRERTVESECGGCRMNAGPAGGPKTRPGAQKHVSGDGNE